MQRYSPDRLRSILSAILPTTVVAIPITMQPGFVQGMVDFVDIDEVTAGYIASAEVMGIMVGTILFAFIAKLYHWGRIMGAALLLVILTNLLTITIGNADTLLALRSLAGLGSGLVTGVGFASLAKTIHLGRNYGLLVACVIGYSALGFAVLPAIFALGGYWTLISIYATACAFCLVGADFVVSDHRTAEIVPSNPDNPTASQIKERNALFSFAGLLSLTSVLLFFVGYTSAWTYMSLIGREAGLGDNEINNALSITQFFGVGGALTIAFLDQRVRHRWISFVLYSMGIVGLFALQMDMTYTMFFALNAVFQFCWNGGQPLLLTIIAARQATEQLLRFAIPLQFIGMAIAPSLAAFVLDKSGGYVAVTIVAGLLATISALAIIPMLKIKRQR